MRVAKGILDRVKFATVKRTARMTSDNRLLISSEKKIQYKKLLQKLVLQSTPSGNVETINTMQDFLGEELLRMGLSVTRYPDPYSGDHVLGTGLYEEDTVLLMGHIDTVHVSDFPAGNWQEKNGKITGPGTFDMKGGIVVILAALDLLYEADELKKIPLKVFFNSDEETGSNSTLKIFSEVLKGVSAGLVFEGGRNENSIVHSRKGIRSYLLSVFGKAAHSGNFHQGGRNAIRALSRIVEDIESLTDYSRNCTASVGLIKGGTAINVIPDLATCEFELRATEEALLEELERKVRSIIEKNSINGITAGLEITSIVPPMSPVKGTFELLDSYIAAASRCGVSMRRMEGIVGGGSNASDISAAGICCIDGLGPSGGGAHTQDEYIEEESLYERAEILATWLLSLMRS